jgi:hypothetical protein
MPRFAVELEYLVPVWTTVVVETADQNHAKAAAYDIDAMPPGCVLANEQMHDFIHVQRYRKEARALARLQKKKGPKQTLLTKERPT